MAGQKIRKILSIILFAASVMAMISVCSADTGNRDGYGVSSPFSSFLDFPGIIGYEIIVIIIALLCILALTGLLYFRSRKAGIRMEKIVEDKTRELTYQTATMKTLLDSIPDLIFIKDLNFRYLQCNNSFLRHYCLQPNDIIGKSDAEGLGLSAEMLEETRLRDRIVLNERNAHRYEEYMPNLQGTETLFETVKAPLIVNGETIGIMGIAHEITRHKKLENEAISASRTKTMFLANMSHEIRTPMNSIIGFTELAKNTSNPPKTTEYLEKILESSQWLLSIINDILDISKIESGKIELEYIPFSLSEMFTYCRSAIMPKAREKKIALHCYAEPVIENKLIGDSVRLRQVILNLLSNAIKFTNVGVVKLLATAKESNEDGITICFEVKDSGVGMSPEHIARIFEPFMQGDGSITRKFGGSGLGLAISKNLVELMGGTLSVESSVDIGSKFSFDLTFKYSKDENETTLTEQDVALSGYKKPQFQGDVLVCEDSDLNREVIYDHLAEVGITPIVAHNGKEGLDIVTERMSSGEKPFDLVLMDIQMPVMDGLEAASKIAELEIKTPIVALTANVMLNDLEIYRTSGFSSFLGKPFTSLELWYCLYKYLRLVGFHIEDKDKQSEEYEKQLNHRRAYFAKTNRDIFERITEALDEGDIKLAHRLSHTLGSNAGQIGEENLQFAAQAVEGMLEDGKNILDTETKLSLDFELRLVLDRLLPLVIDNVSNTLSRITDRKRIVEILEELEEMLISNETRSRNMLYELMRIPEAENLAQYVEEFEFEKALDELKKFRKEMIINEKD